MRKSLICFLLCDLTPISSSKSIWHIRYHSSSGPWSKNTIVYSIISIFKRQALEKREMSTLPKPSMQTSSRDDAVQLNRAFKGLGCDTAVVVNVLGNRNASQRDSIQQEYETLFSDDLKKQLALELHGHLKKAVLLWMKSPVERDVTTLRQALTGPIIDIKTATEIICTRISSQIRQIKQVYTPTFGTLLEYDIGYHTSGDHRKFLLAYIDTTRYDGPEIERVLVEEDAIAISKIEVKKSGMDESTFIQIFTERSSAHLAALASAYHKMFRKELRKTIKRETSGNFKYALLTILEYAIDPTKHYATMLRKAMKGLGTDDSTLIRILATRAEIDLQKIKEDYLKRYKRPLVEVVHSDTSGYYRAFLLSLLGSKF
ncbi:hypothetical protein BDE02_10G089700 [Populus trichocarpa]|nr:hypothetical protein BDE02_10G089700 [Populus trichocarpa]